jgi:transcriptional regulator with XRE-family HTH domain
MHAQRIPAANERCTIAHACLGRAIQDLRTRRGLTHHQLGTAILVNACYVRALEAGRINPPFHVLLNLIHGLGVTLPQMIAQHQRHLETYPGRPAERSPAPTLA